MKRFQHALSCTFFGAALLILHSLIFLSCDEDVSSIGNSLTGETDKLNISATDFVVPTRTLVAGRVLAVGSDCYLGRVEDPVAGAVVTSDFTTQFHILETLYISPDENIVSRPDGIAGADSCDLVLYLSSPFCQDDSLTAMKMRIMELARPAEEGTLYYSDYDPVASGMVRSDGFQVSKVFSYDNLNDSESQRAQSSYLHNVRVPLTGSYTDPHDAAKTYPNYGTYLMQQYFQHPEYYRSSYAFAQHVCPGFLFKVTDGSGFHAKVSNIGLRVYYRVNIQDSVYNAVLTLAGTQEVLQTTHITNDDAALAQLAADETCTWLKTPAGLFTEATLPVEQIRAGHAADSLVGAKIIFHRLANNSFDARALGTPSTLLMVQKDSLSRFFEEHRVADESSTFVASFSSATNTYTFTNIGTLITQLDRLRQEGEAAQPGWTAAHPDWNKVVLVPVDWTYYSTTSGNVTTGISHDLSLTSTRLVGGQQTDTPVTISIVYAKFKE